MNDERNYQQRSAEHLFPPVVVVMYVLNAEIESQQYKECQATLLARLLYI
jgi:hypothetical protein